MICQLWPSFNLIGSSICSNQLYFPLEGARSRKLTFNPTTDITTTCIEEDNCILVRLLTVHFPEFLAFHVISIHFSISIMI